MTEQPEQSNSEKRGDPWATVAGFRVVPCADAARRSWVEISCSDRIVELSAGDALMLAEHLTRVTRTALAWKGSRS